MTPGAKAENRLSYFGIRDPKDIDVEAIAFDAGVKVVYEDLRGCEATLVGLGSAAIATIRPSDNRSRERFSIGHELGHWELHRGQRFRCRVDDPSENFIPDRAKEREADLFSAHLLMPSWLFNPVIAALGTPSFNKLREVSEHFETSLVATSIRMADVHKLPAIVACYRGDQYRWSESSDSIPRRWLLKRELDEDSFSFDLVRNKAAPPQPRKQPAETWFENSDADRYEVLEHCVAYGKTDVLVILYLTDSGMLDARFDPNVGSVKYGVDGPKYSFKRSK